jgi:hypothetical protein
LTSQLIIDHNARTRQESYEKTWKSINEYFDCDDFLSNYPGNSDTCTDCLSSSLTLSDFTSLGGFSHILSVLIFLGLTSALLGAYYFLNNKNLPAFIPSSS